jgi:hypothetical protein
MRNRLTSLVLLAFSAILMADCGSAHQVTSKEVETEYVKTVAVLPVQVNFTGTLPGKLSESALDSLRRQQGLSFQRSLHANLMRYNGGKKKIQGVVFQSADKTNGLLEKNRIDWRAVNNMDPDELARLLQVDAVVKMNVTSNRMMSDMVSFGLGALRNILFWETNTSPNVTDNISSKTADVYADCALLKDGKTLWTAQYNEATSWKTSVNEVMQSVTKKMGKGFPY